MDNYVSFLDATPEKGVIIVEFYWQERTPASPGTKRGKRAIGSRTSLVFFKQIRAADECWCGSKRKFARCHRRKDDWTYVTLDPDQETYSPVVLLERTFSLSNFSSLRKILDSERGLLPLERSESLAAWGVPMQPPVVSEAGELVLGTIGLSHQQVHLETNSEKRFDHLAERVKALAGDSLGDGSTIRAEPQQPFAPAVSRKTRKRAQA